VSLLPGDILACDRASYPGWRSVLLFADDWHVRTYPTSEGPRRVVFISTHQRAFVFVFNFHNHHGCGLYERPARFP
jgi:hypothetical protein